MQNENCVTKFINQIKGLSNMAQYNRESHYADLQNTKQENPMIMIRPYGLKGGGYWEDVITKLNYLLLQLRNKKNNYKIIDGILNEILTSLEDDEIIIQNESNIENNIKFNLKSLEIWIKEEAPKKRKQILTQLINQIKNGINNESGILTTTTTNTKTTTTKKMTTTTTRSSSTTTESTESSPKESTSITYPSLNVPKKKSLSSTKKKFFIIFQ
ncbi:hypothetical protein M0813_07481 [Anaeramoeba flamelloides]|uniref:Uncharacterized protein n=1 Tax=Anaeramoeba flamelloides TaxID=1746091 RepID=A0ABQ8XBQ0_9EUKA|nr:hypothetical protein M0813_07481 [Anaeramoeba flamelloides]